MLQEDRYEYMGTAQCEGAHDESGLLSHTPTFSESIIEGGVNHNKHKPKLTKQFLQKLEYLEEHNINGLIVFEMLGGNLLMASSKYPQAFPLILNTVMARFRVKIVINYKYLFDYITSMYNQHIKPTGKYNAENKNWPGQAGPDGKKGDYIRPFDTESQEALYYLKMIKRNRQSKTAIVRQKYIHAGVDPRDISILDMTVSHQTVLTALLCDHLPGASGACAHARAGTFPIPPKDKMSANPSFPINYDILATAAWKDGLVNTTNLSRGTVIQAIKARQEKQLNRTLHDFPKTCMDTKKIQKLLTLSIEVDRNLFGTSQTREEALTQKFWDGKPTKLCSVDTNVVLADPEWRDWFANTTTMTM
ncbi:expressed unknown protein [Seminavis robusta]|nr:expressed unknown protein [Seminavis robusta]|eukprot:Sro1219_g253420.1 n/a (362) ;mRNA; r:14827-15912